MLSSHTRCVWLLSEHCDVLTGPACSSSVSHLVPCLSLYLYSSVTVCLSYDICLSLINFTFLSPSLSQNLYLPPFLSLLSQTVSHLCLLSAQFCWLCSAFSLWLTLAYCCVWFIYTFMWWWCHLMLPLLVRQGWARPNNQLGLARLHDARGHRDTDWHYASLFPVKEAHAHSHIGATNIDACVMHNK